jgi:hypothetical protein
MVSDMKITAGFDSWVEAFERNPFQFTYTMLSAPEPRERLMIMGRHQYAIYSWYRSETLSLLDAQGANWRRVKRERRKDIKRRLRDLQKERQWRS